MLMLLIVGFNIGVRGRSSYVICGAKAKKMYMAEPGRTEWVTVIECICADGNTIPPLVIFKGQNLQTAWVPREMDKDWSWACNTKGWTCNAIGEEWMRKCFEPTTRSKANGGTRLLVCDGHGSHVTASFIKFCMDSNIEVLLLPPHSSHLTQPLDVGIFSPLKQKMAEELDRILRYGVPNLKKFEWANCYQIARPQGMTSSNIESAWSGAGLIPFKPQKVIRRVKAGAAEAETLKLIVGPPPSIETLPTLSPKSKFNLVPTTPSRVDPAVLRSANEALFENIDKGILDTPTSKYITKVIGMYEQTRATGILVQKHFDELNAIVKKRRVMSQGIRVVLKDQVHITTVGLYEQLKAREEVTASRKRSSGGKTKENASEVDQIGADNSEEMNEDS